MMDLAVCKKEQACLVNGAGVNPEEYSFSVIIRQRVKHAFYLLEES